MTSVIVPRDMLGFHECVQACLITVDGDTRVCHGMRGVERREGGRKGCDDIVSALDDRIVESCFSGSQAKVRYGILCERGRQKALVTKIDAGGKTIEGIDNRKLVCGIVDK